MQFTWYKVALFLIFMIPSFIMSAFIMLLTLQSIAIALILAVVVSICLSIIVDEFVTNPVAKILIAVVSAALSIIAVRYYLGRSIICDPVHNPNICDPVHNPSPCEQACDKILQNAANQSDIVMQKFNECMQKCYN